MDQIKILLVDDQPLTEHLLRRMISGQGDMILHACDDPMQAENLAESLQPTIILLDMVMPGVDGLGLLNRFRRRKGMQQVPIIILSGQEEAALKALAFQSGANDFLIKLPEKTEMLARLRYHAHAYFNHIGAENHVRESREAEKKYRNLFEHSRDAIFLVDALSGMLMDCNPAADTLLTLSREEMVGKYFPDLLTSRRSDHVKNLFEEHIRQGRDLNTEVYLLRSDGSRIPVDVSATIFVQEERFYSQWMLRDLTERKQLLQSLEETLTVAEASNRVRGEFLVTLEEEIRKPIQVLEGISRQLCHLPKGECSDSRYSIGDLVECADQLAIFFHEILEMARLEAGRIEFIWQDFSPGDLAKGVLAAVTEQAQKKGIELALYISPEMPAQAQGDAPRLRQILFNLMNNAVKFTERGRVQLSVRRANRPGEENFALFSVADTGMGIPYEEQEAIFRPFYKVADHSRSGELGLGLSICRHLVELMGGRIGVKSHVGEGCTFYFTMRLDGWDGGKEGIGTPGQHIPSYEQGKRRIPLSPLRGALVDFPLPDRLPLQAMLQQEPCQIDLLDSNAQDFAYRCRAGFYDFFLVYLADPGTEGVGAVWCIRSLAREGKMKNFTLAGMAEDAHDPRLIVGCDLVLTRPVERQQVMELLNLAKQPS